MSADNASAGPPAAPLANPMHGTAISTSPTQLGLSESRKEKSTMEDEDRDKGIIARTVDKLGRSKSGESKGGSSKLGHRRVFSLSRKNRRKDSLGGSDNGDDSDVERSTSPTNAITEVAERMTHSFKLPPSASAASPERLTRPPVAPFGVAGSMRPGTQTFIQALQAMPWDDDRGEDDSLNITREKSDHYNSSDDENDDDNNEFTLASSIHTIHRPVALARATPKFSQKLTGLQANADDYFATLSEGDEEDDFEPSPLPLKSSQMKRPGPPGSALRPKLPQMSSLATVRIQRRARLADKLRDVFGLQEIEEVLAEMPCWLLRSILLQGYMYLTNAHLCFFAHLPSREDQVLKSGSMSKKAQRTKRWNKHWFVLKNDVLSWYQSSTDPYFPHGNIDLRYAISCEPHHQKGIRLRTNTKTITLDADSVPSRDEWVKAVQKVIFKAQNMGESVKIVIPYSAILDVDMSDAMDFSETIEVKVVDKDENFTVDSYFFAYFHDISQALEHIRDAVHAYKHSPSSSEVAQPLLDTTALKSVTSPASTNPTPDRTSTLPSTEANKSTTSKIASLLKPFSSDSSQPTRSSSTPTSVETLTSHDDGSSSTGTLHPPVSRSAIPPAEPVHNPSSSSVTSTRLIAPTNGARPPLSQSPVPMEHTYPPSPSASSPSIMHNSANMSGSNWSVPSWLRNPSRRLLSSVSSLDQSNSPQGNGIQDIYEGLPPGQLDHRLPSGFSDMSDGLPSHMGFSMLEAPDHAHLPDPYAAEKFRATFAFDDKEVLLGYLPGYLFRTLPVYGKVFISTNYFCFRASQPLAKTRMIIPIRDILAIERQKAFTFSRSGLVVVIKGHEELFLEFSGSDKRDSCVALLESQMEDLRRRSTLGETAPPTQGARDAQLLEELEPSSSTSGLSDTDPRPPPETLSESLPAVMFTSTSSTFLNFKPQQSLHFTCLTIGTRGDVQPYIALCKGLQADGHRTRIATHVEYKDWVEGHGIEFGVVGGDPAELMRICVENGMFTVSFLKEGIQKFRGWIDDLLATSWTACQNTDVLIESPSAMGGIHIAEALQIPFFRAFTMPWTRTRAYPHAFAVPDRKMGGSYNYMTYVMFDQVFWRGTAGQINRWRRHTLGLDSTNLDKMEQHKVPFLYNFSPSIVPPPLDWYEWIRVTGYWFLDDPDNSATKKWTPPPGLLEFIDNAHAKGGKVVYIGFGSIVVSDPEAMTKCVVEAIEESGVYAILSKGWSDRLAAKKNPDLVATAQPEVPLPDCIYPVQSIPHDWLFERIDAACHHGGAGTTGASLRAGIPTIIKPFFGDQMFWADRVEALGIGASVKKLTTESLTAALKNATTDIKQIERAKLVGQQIRSETGVANAVEAIYRDLEYARSLIKNTAKPSDEHADDGEEVDEGATLKHRRIRSRSDAAEPLEHSLDSSTGSARSEDWSVVSGDEDPEKLGMTSSPKRKSFAATTMQVLHYALNSSGTPSVPATQH